jgi:hypothetical protein
MTEIEHRAAVVTTCNVATRSHVDKDVTMVDELVFGADGCPVIGDDGYVLRDVVQKVTLEPRCRCARLAGHDGEFHAGYLFRISELECWPV